MKFYLASRYSRNAEMREYRQTLKFYGHEVTSRWIDQHGGEVPVSFSSEHLTANPEACAVYANLDIADILVSDAVINFTGEGGKGGRHIEFGYAYALKKKLFVVGPRENVFHTLPSIIRYKTFEEFVYEELLPY